MKFIKFPKIPSFQNLIKEAEKYGYEYSFNEVELTEKLHGTFGAVCLGNNGLYCQNRNRILNTQQDNQGFHIFVMKKEKEFERILNSLVDLYNINLKTTNVSLCGEFAGKGIQSKSGVSGVNKGFYVFPYFILEQNDDVSWAKVPNDLLSKDRYTQMIFPIAEAMYRKIDFLGYSTKEIYDYIKLTVDDIEKSSMIGKTFWNIEGNVGEGVVGYFWFKGQLKMFKVKGEKHLKSSKIKKKQTKMSDEEKQKIYDFANSILPKSRLEQMYDAVNGYKNGMKVIGEYLKKVAQDTLVEENISIQKSGYEWKVVSKYIVKIAKDFYKKMLEEF